MKPSLTLVLQSLFLLGTLAPKSTLGGSISDSLLEKLSSEGISDVIIELPSVMTSVLSKPSLKLLSGAAKAEMMTSLMKDLTSAAQAPLMEAITSMGLTSSATPFFISNDIALKSVSLPNVQALSAIPGIFTIREPFKVQAGPMDVQPSMYQPPSTELSQGQWGVNKVGAPKVWDILGKKGEGIIVANIDTGVNLYHEALRGNYAGHWYDPIRHDSYPTDYVGHGTHTMGTICGQTHGIGVAPGAKWIACRGLDANNNGNEDSIKVCAQWILEQRPHIVSNSWGGGQGRNWFDDVITAWKSVGIMSVFSIGNSGPDCETANSPGDSDLAWSVGSTREYDTISEFSSRGSNGYGTIKPEVSAPGEKVVSAYYKSTNSYAIFSGTSMACPHVAGAMALMLSANKTFTFDQIKQKLEETAVHPTLDNGYDVCGSYLTTTSSPYPTYPNNAYGNGRISVANALGL